MSAQSAMVSVASAGDNVIVAAVPGSAIRVLGYVLSFAGAVNVRWYSDVGGSFVPLSGLLTGTAAGNALCAPAIGSPARGWFQTAAGKALNLNLSAAVGVGGHVLYEVIPQ